MFLFDVILDSTTSSLRDPQFDILLFKKKSTELSMKGLLSLSHVVSTFWPFIGERRIDTQYTYIKKKKKRTQQRGEKEKETREIFKTCFWLPLELVSFESSDRSANGISTLDPILSDIL